MPHWGACPARKLDKSGQNGLASGRGGRVVRGRSCTGTDVSHAWADDTMKLSGVAGSVRGGGRNAELPGALARVRGSPGQPGPGGGGGRVLHVDMDAVFVFGGPRARAGGGRKTVVGSRGG